MLFALVLWALVLLGMSASLRFRWVLLYAGTSVGALWIAVFGLLAFYDGKQDEHGEFIIEGPEFFGAAFLVFGGTIFAAVVLLIGGVVALIRNRITPRTYQSEHS